jgi:hypothetical protein
MANSAPYLRQKPAKPSDSPVYQDAFVSDEIAAKALGSTEIKTSLPRSYDEAMQFQDFPS